MKQMVLLGFAFILFIITGCEQKGREISSQPKLQIKVYEGLPPGIWDGTSPSNEVLPDFFPAQSQTNAFPESMVGIWEATVDEYNSVKWGIKFEPDGSIKKIVHTVAGEVNIAEGGVGAEMPEGSFYNFVMGPCEARYIPETGVIKMKVIVDYFIMKINDGELEGRIEDYFEGPVSEDGKTWKVGWREYGWLKNAKLPDINEITANPVPLVFTKLDLTQIQKEDAAQ